MSQTGDNDRHAAERPYLGTSARSVLVLAFSILLALLVAGGWNALTTLEQMHKREQTARMDFLSRREPLMAIHSKLTIYGDLTQKSASEPASFQEAHRLFSQIRSELTRYPTTRKPEEQLLISHLQTMLADQNRAGTAILILHDPARVKNAVGTELLPGHFRVVAATEKIEFWNDQQFRSVNAELLTSFHLLREKLKRLLFVLLGSGLAIALGSAFLIASQENEIRKRYDELARSHDARVQLSARLLNAQEQERLSLSRELHDEVGQSLGALLVDVGRLAAMLPADDAAAQEEIRKIRLLTETSVSSVRNIALLLRPSMLDDLGLIAAVEWQAREVSRRCDVEVEVQAQELTSELSEPLKICIYRVIQEALNNVARHSGARHAWVSIEAEKQKITVQIRDDGKGFDPQRTRGLGLLGMEERIRLLHGSLQVDSTLGKGATITAQLPLA